MTLADHDLSALLAALKAGEMTDTIRTSLEWTLQQLIEAEATAVIGANPYERSETRTALRNGHRSRLLSTPAGDVELAIPKLRAGSFFPSLLERCRRVDRAPFAVVMEADVHGASTRKLDDVVKALSATAGSADLTERMFRHLVVTGRSRMAIGVRRVQGSDEGGRKRHLRPTREHPPSRHETRIPQAVFRPLCRLVGLLSEPRCGQPRRRGLACPRKGPKGPTGDSGAAGTWLLGGRESRV